MPDEPDEEVPQPVRLPDPPTDGITGLQFLSGPKTNHLLASTSWDGAIRIHDIGNTTDSSFDNAKLQLSQNINVGPLLSLACSLDEDTNGSVLYAGALDGSVWQLDVASNAVTKIGQHQSAAAAAAALADNQTTTTTTAAACSSVALLPPLVVTAGWDRHLYVWDARTSSSSDNNNNNNNITAAVTVDLPGKAFCMHVDALHSRVAVGCSGRQTCLVDVRRPDQTIQAELSVQGESSQKHQTRCLRFFPDGQRIAVGSVEGRVAVEWVDGRPLDANGNMPKEYAFKCHRRNDLVFPVNCIEFHPKYGTFATGGGDGTVVTWDGFNRKRLTALPAFGTSVAALAFNHDGTALAMASSYTFEEGERDHPRDEIFIRRMLDSDCQPKTQS